MVKRKQPERHIQLQIIHYMKLKGFAIGKLKTTGARRGNAFLLDPTMFKGVADLLAFTPALTFIEVKAPGGRLSADQIIFRKLCLSSGTPYIIAYSLDDIIKLFP